MYAIFNKEGKVDTTYSYNGFEGPVLPNSYLLTNEQEENIRYLKLVNGEIIIDFAQKEIDELKSNKHEQIQDIKKQMSDIEKQYIQNQLLGEYAVQTISDKTLNEQYIELYQKLIELEE